MISVWSRTARLAAAAAAALAVLTLLADPALGQASHDVRVSIPTPLYGIRILDGSGVPAIAPGVHFDFASDPGRYLEAASAGAPVVPTDVTSFADIEVRAEGGLGLPLWEVHVSALPLTHHAGAGGGLDVGDVWIDRGASSGLAPGLAPSWGAGWLWDVVDSWRLGTIPTRIAFGRTGTFGWRSLGFHGGDYRLDLHADEAPGAYRTIVTYTMVAP